MVLAIRPDPAHLHVMANPTLLPTADTLERYLAIRGDHARLQPGVTALCDGLGLHGLDVVRFTDGSLPVYAIGDTRVLKLYPGPFRTATRSNTACCKPSTTGCRSLPQGWSTPASSKAGATCSWSAYTANPSPSPGPTSLWRSAIGWPPSSERHGRPCMPSPRRSWTRSGRPTGTCSWASSALAVSTDSAQPAWTPPGWSRSQPSSTA
jgi:hypothetical protein